MSEIGELPPLRDLWLDLRAAVQFYVRDFIDVLPIWLHERAGHEVHSELVQLVQPDAVGENCDGELVKPVHVARCEWVCSCGLRWS